MKIKEDVEDKREHERERDRENDVDRDREREREREREKRDKDRDRERDRERDRDRGERRDTGACTAPQPSLFTRPHIRSHFLTEADICLCFIKVAVAAVVVTIGNLMIDAMEM